MLSGRGGWAYRPTSGGKIADAWSEAGVTLEHSRVEANVPAVLVGCGLPTLAAGGRHIFSERRIRNRGVYPRS